MENVPGPPVTCVSIEPGPTNTSAPRAMSGRVGPGENHLASSHSVAATETGGDAGRHGVEAAMEDPNIAVAVDMHPDDLAPTAAIHALGQGRPAFDEAIGIGKLGRFGIWRLGLRRADVP